MISLSNRTLIGRLLLEQKSLEQRLTHKMMAARMQLVGDAQIIQSNTWKQFFTCKPGRKTEGKLISISQSIGNTPGNKVVFHFLKVVQTQLGNVRRLGK